MAEAQRSKNFIEKNISSLERVEWRESVGDLIRRLGADKGAAVLHEAIAHSLPDFFSDSPANGYINTISPKEQPDYPGDLGAEEKLTNIMRWNAAMLVLRANAQSPGIGGHLSTYASTADLFEVGFHHFLKGANDTQIGDLVYFQGHASPGIYARAYLEGRLNEMQLAAFRRECGKEQGLSSYPHPWLMPDFWQFPTVSMGLSPIMAIYQARFLKYIQARKLGRGAEHSRVWVFLGDGEMDEPESLGALTVAARERLGNLIFVISCNLQRLDGPVRGNGNIINELARHFQGAGWNVIKVIWGSGWDQLFARDEEGLLARRLAELVDGDYQKLIVSDGKQIREKIFNTPKLKKIATDLTDGDLADLNYGGHDFKKVYAAYKRAIESQKPSVILARTIKGNKLGHDVAGRNITHQQKSMDEKSLRTFRDRLEISVSDDDLKNFPLCTPKKEEGLSEYLLQKREQLGGFLPKRSVSRISLKIPALDIFDDVLSGSDGKEVSTTMSFGRILSSLLKHKNLGERIVPIIPDEARTFGLEPLFGKYGIYNPLGQKYEPVDAGHLIEYKESITGQILEEGITEAGAMSSFIAAGTSYSNLSLPMIPFYIFYSMFGFQRTGDLIWAAGDSRTRGFLLGATSGRSSLAGEGLQHQDGHSPLIAGTVPNIISYDPAYGYELAVIIRDGLRRMYQEGESVFYYINLYNDTYEMPEFENDSEPAILSGIHRITNRENEVIESEPQILASGPLVPEALRAAQLLENEIDESCQVWSVTSWAELARNASDAERSHRLEGCRSGENNGKESILATHFAIHKAPIVGVSDYVRGVAGQIAPYMPPLYYALGTDGFGRSDSRVNLRNHFEISAEWLAHALVWGLYLQEKIPISTVKSCCKKWNIPHHKENPQMQ